MPQNIQHTVSESSIIAWLIGMASTAVIFFLAWGLKDVKARYDKIPELVNKISVLETEIAHLKEQVK